MTTDTTPDKAQLLPCPFCGCDHTAIIVSAADQWNELHEGMDSVPFPHSPTWAVFCDAATGGPGGCGGSAGYKPSAAEAIKAWNFRAALSVPAAAPQSEPTPAAAPRGASVAERTPIPALPKGHVWVCANGCGNCHAVLIPFEYARVETMDGELLESRSYLRAASHCCRADLMVWDEVNDCDAPVPSFARGIDSGEAGETRSGSTPQGQEPGPAWTRPEPQAGEREALAAEVKRLERILCDEERRLCIGKASVTDVVGARNDLHAAIDRLAAVTPPTVPTEGNWIAADDYYRNVRELDVALNGEGAAARPALIDVVSQVESVARLYGMPVLAALAAASPPPPTAADVGMAPPEAEGAMLTDAELANALFAVLRRHNDNRAWRALTYESGPYEVTCASRLLLDLGRAAIDASRRRES